MEARMNWEDGKITLECESNSIEAMMSCAKFLLDSAQSRLEKIDDTKLPQEDAAILYALLEHTEAIHNYWFHSLEDCYENANSSLDFLFKSEEPFLIKPKKKL